jgi:hypothetical protein
MKVNRQEVTDNPSRAIHGPVQQFSVEHLKPAMTMPAPTIALRSPAAVFRIMATTSCPYRKLIRVESAESSMLCEIMVLSTMNPRLVALFAGGVAVNICA